MPGVLVAGPAPAQTAMSVRSVLVSVSDASGRPVVGLGQHDFEIEIDGVEVDALDAGLAWFLLVLWSTPGLRPAAT